MATDSLRNRTTSTTAQKFIGSAAAVAATLVLATSVTSAQQTGTDDEVVDEVIITGSRIPRSGFETLQPATVLDAEQLDLRGNISLAKSLNEQPGFATPSTTPIGLGPEGSTDQNFLDFLGLGEQRTLTLVNGQRFPAAVAPNGVGGLSVDINAIPENLVERVETIAIGGAPIYGSDAIAGTVNIILKDDFEGLELVASGGGALEYNDATEVRFGATWGKNFDNGRGNVTLSGQYTSSDGLRMADRPTVAGLTGFEVPGDPSSPYSQELFHDLTVAIDNSTAFPLFFGDAFFASIWGNGIPVDIYDPNSPLAEFDANGNLVSFIPGGGTGSPIWQEGGDGLKVMEKAPLYTDTERYNATVLTSYALTDSLRLKAEAWFARTDATAPTGDDEQLYNSPFFGGLPFNNYGNVGQGPIPVLIDNPFLVPATRASIAAALDIVHDFDLDGQADPTIDTDGDGAPDAVGFWRGGVLSNLSANQSSTRRNTYRAVIGLEGDLNLGGRDYLWDVTYTYGRTESDAQSININQANFEQAIQVVTDGNGDPACADPSGGCVPLDVIGIPTPEAVAYVTALVTDEVVTDQRVLSANISGDLFDLPAGPIGVAAGFAYREESASFDPNDLAESGPARFTLVPVAGEFDSTEFYAETVIPLLGGDRDTPLVKTLDFEAAIRFVDNSIAGNDTTWTAGLRYRPVDDLEFRGNLTESIRAPSVTELFTPESHVIWYANDPCDARYIGQGNVPDTRAANCAAAGIVQPFTSILTDAGQMGTLSGNPDLVSEIAESATFGVIFRPRFLDGLTASIDWFDIDIANAIESLGATDILEACYDSADFSSEPSCNLFERDDASSEPVNMHMGFRNIGRLEFTGIQTVISYDTELGRFGSLNIGLNHLYTDKHYETLGSAGDTRQLDGEIGASEHRVNLNTTWYKGDWTWYNQIRWLSSAVFDNSDAEFTRNISGVDAWTVVDTTVVYAFSDNLDIRLTVDNLFDNDAPYPTLQFQEHSVATYFPGIRGRYATLTMRASFD